MTIQETITLLNAGYTKSDIEAMSAPAPAETQPIQQSTVQQTPVQQPAIQQTAALTPETLAALQQLMQAPAQPVVHQAPAQPVVHQAPAQPVVQQAQAQPVQQPQAQQPLTLSPEQLQQLIQGVAVQTAGGTVETPPSAQTALEKMYESIVGETAKKEE